MNYLTREEWKELWQAIKIIEHEHLGPGENEDLSFCDICNRIKFIKDKIQQVIGQME